MSGASRSLPPRSGFVLLRSIPALARIYFAAAVRSAGGVMSWRRSRAARTLRCRVVLEQLSMRVLPSATPASASVSDYRYSTFDQGVDSSETVLTPANVQSNFGQLWNTQQIDGQIYAQPVFIPNLPVTVNGITTTQNTVIVGTEKNMVYWLSADTGAALRSLSLDQFGIAGATVTPVPSSDVGSGTTHTQVYPWIGILGTPAFDSKTGMLYVVAYKKEIVPGQATIHYVYDLEQINARTGAVVQSTIADTGYTGTIITYFTGSPSVPGNGAGALNGTLYFDARLQGQRPAVTLVTDNTGNEGILVGYEGHDDTGHYHGWELAISTSNLKVNGVFCTTPNGEEGGVWRAPIADSRGNIWIVVGNGTFDTQADSRGMPAHGDLGDSVVRLEYTPQGLQLVDYFTPANQQHLSNKDLDLDAGGLVMLPNESALIAVGKDGSIYLLNPFSLGRFNAAGDQVTQELLTVLPTVSSVGAVFTEPTFFDNTLYVTVANGHAYAFSYTPGAAIPLSPQPTQVTHGTFTYPGVVGTVSANGATSGILWTLSAATGLEAYSVSAGLGSVLYSSTTDPNRDQAPDYVKFTVPVVADGMVFVAGDSEVAAYGLLSAAQPPGSPAAESSDTQAIVTLVNALGPGTAVRLEANGQLWLDQGGSSVLLDDHSRNVVAAGLGGAPGIFDLKNDSSDLYFFNGAGWQLVDTSARQIARAVLPDGEGSLIDLKAASTDLYALTFAGWQLIDDGAGTIVQGETGEGLAAVFDLKAASTDLYAFGDSGWQLMDDGAGMIAAGSLAGGQPAIFDLKSGSTDLYAFSTSGWRPINGVVDTITPNELATGRAALLGPAARNARPDLTENPIWQLVDNGSGTIAQALTADGTTMFDLKAGSSDLYSLTASGWQLMDNGAGTIAAGVLADGRPTLFDLKAGSTDLYALTGGGWLLIDNGAGQIFTGMLQDGRSVLFDRKAGSGDVFFLSTSGWQLAS
jgi:hypothetical protein